MRSARQGIEKIGVSLRNLLEILSIIWSFEDFINDYVFSLIIGYRFKAKTVLWNSVIKVLLDLGSRGG